MDSDDAIVKTALERLYSIAKHFDAEVIYSDRSYDVASDDDFTTDEEILKKLPYGAPNLERDFILLSENLEERVMDIVKNCYNLVPWRFLFRRSLILQHDIKFPALKGGEDSVFDLHALLTAKKVVITSAKFYIHRQVRGSHGDMGSRSAEEVVSRYVSVILKEVDIYDELMSRFEIFDRHPEYKLLFFDYIVSIHLSVVLHIYGKSSLYELDALIRRELEKIRDTTALTAFLFNRMNVFDLSLAQQSATIQQLNAQIQNQNQVIQQLQTQLQKLQQS